MKAEPEWEQITSDGTWAWHDHRIRWMSPDTPPQITRDTTQEVFSWEVPLIVDGEPVVRREGWNGSRLPTPSHPSRQG